MNLVGELVINQAQIKERTSLFKDSILSGAVKTMERLISDLRDNTLSIRLLPVGTIFSKFNRLVRDLSSELGKDIEMITEGAETELDKTVIEHLNDPLVHLIRNCIDHGIETPEVRKKAGKPAKGTIHLSAIQSEAYVLIKIKDDGKGIDSEVIYSKGIEKGLISSDDKLSEKQIFDLIMLPGFSTAKEITSVSGRGVGMDVVKQNVETLGGSIEIASKKGSGTTITLKLPITLAIIDGLLSVIGDEYFIFPLSAVEKNVELTKKDIENACGRHIIRVNDRITPYIRLSEYLNISSVKPKIEQIVITNAGGMRVGFVVDKVIGNQQTVIKTLGRVFKNVKGLFGATILGNGTVALILDVNQLIEGSEEVETVMRDA
jgi:two-component system chemotaxis sensor kinase CheA